MSNVRSLSDGKEGLSNQLALLFENDWEDIVVKMMYFGFRVFITCVVRAESNPPGFVSLFGNVYR